MKKLLSVALSLLMLASMLTLPILALAEGAAAKAEIVVGNIQDLSGPTSVLGNMVTNGLTLNIDRMNANGGMDGHPVKLITYDTKGDVKEAVNAYNRLCDQEKASVIVAPPVSNIALALAPISHEKKVPMVSLAGDPAVYKQENGEAQPYIILVQNDNGSYGRLMASYAVHELGFKKLAVLYNQANAYAVSNVEPFKEYTIANGAEIVAEEVYVTGDTDFSAQFSKVMAAGPEAIFMPNYTQDNVLALRQKYQLGIEIPILGALDHCPPTASMVENPDAADNVYFANNISMTDPKLAQVRDLYFEKTGAEPINKVFLGWDCALVIEECVRLAGDDVSPAAMAAQLNHIKDLEITTGNLTIDPDTHLPSGLKMVIYKMVKGEYEEIGWYTAQ